MFKYERMEVTEIMHFCEQETELMLRRWSPFET